MICPGFRLRRSSRITRVRSTNILFPMATVFTFSRRGVWLNLAVPPVTPLLLCPTALPIRHWPRLSYGNRSRNTLPEFIFCRSILMRKSPACILKKSVANLPDYHPSRLPISVLNRTGLISRSTIVTELVLEEILQRFGEEFRSVFFGLRESTDASPRRSTVAIKKQPPFRRLLV